MKKFVATPPHTVQVVDGDGRAFGLNPRLDLRNHSPTGFSWGYAGSGPSQLALALLASVLGDEVALRHYRQFKFDVIAALPRDEPWQIPESAIRSWYADRAKVIDR